MCQLGLLGNRGLKGACFALQVEEEDGGCHGCGLVAWVG